MGSDWADEQNERESTDHAKWWTYISLEQVKDLELCSRYVEDYPTRCFCLMTAEVLILGSLYGLPNISRFIRKLGRDRGPQPATELTTLASMRGSSPRSGAATASFSGSAGSHPAGS